MRRRPAVYGLDIETDTTENGLDPRVAAVVTVALAGPGFEEVFTGREEALLADLDERIGQLEPGVIATWNGAAFDLPFLADRAALHELPIGLRLRHDRAITMRRAPLPGHRGAYRASWFEHGHLDAYRLYRGDVGPALIEVDRTRIHDLSNEALHAYAASDARLARILTERRWGTASRFIDRVGPDEADVPVAPRRGAHAIPA